MWRDIADMNPLKSNNELVTYHSCFACPLLDLQADSRTRARNRGAPLMPPRYLHLDLPKHVMRNVSRFRLRAHTLAAESSIWCGGNGHCDKCSCASVQNEVHVRLVCVLSQKKVLVPILPFLPILFYGGPLYSTCLA